MITCIYHGNRSGFFQLVNQLASGVAGQGPLAGEITRGIQMRMGVALLSKVQQAFIVKSRGGVGSDGIRWKPLSPRTIAARRVSATEKRTLAIGGRRERGMLTPAQNQRWKSIFGSRLARLMAQGMNEAAAKTLAAKIAWAVLKQEGAQTKLQVLGSRQVDIGRDTGALLRSLTPGVEDKPSNADGQVFEVQPGLVIVGTNVPYASRFHRDRPLWPEIMPTQWSDAVNAAASRGIALALAQILGGPSS